MNGPEFPHLWTREGFLGDLCVTARPHAINEYTDAVGPHAPRRIDLNAVAAPDRDNPGELPTLFARSRTGVTLSVSALSHPTPYVWRNAESDEVHFIQLGEFDYVTDWGTLRAAKGDFVFLPRASTYRVVPISTPTLRILIETPETLDLKPPAPFGMINASRDISRPDASRASQAAGETTLIIKTFDGQTRFTVPRDPLAMTQIIAGQAPVWRLSLADIQPLTYVPHGGPPSHFVETPTKDLLLYTLSSRPGGRPPQHHNADYDELVFYFEGASPYGGLDMPGLMAWIPKGVTHWGPREDPPGGFLAWLVESAGTVRLTPVGLAASELMETGQFGTQMIDSHTAARVGA